MIIAVKKENEIVVGITVCDSLVDMTEKDLSLTDNLPFWKVKGVNDCYVFAEDLTFSTDLLRYNNHIFKNINDGNSIISDVIPKMKELLGKYSRIIDGKEWDSQLLIVVGGKLFTIGHYFTVSEIDDFTGLGFEQYLIGGLNETKEYEPKESILFAVRNLNRMRSRNFFPILLFDAKTNKKKGYYQ